MWYLNKRTGVSWDADPVTAKRLSASPDYEPCEPPQAEQSLGGSVLHTERGVVDMPAPPPGVSPDPDNLPLIESQESNTDDNESHSTHRNLKPDPAARSASKRRRTSSR